jgi:hypothetical protein
MELIMQALNSLSATSVRSCSLSFIVWYFLVLIRSCRFDKEYLVQILPTKDEHPTAELIETISAELRAIQTHLDFDVNGRSHPEFDLITALTSNIRKPIPRLINPADPGVSPKLLHAKYRSVCDHFNQYDY